MLYITADSPLVCAKQLTELSFPQRIQIYNGLYFYSIDSKEYNTSLKTWPLRVVLLFISAPIDANQTLSAVSLR